jgi:hypothetical protein
MKSKLSTKSKPSTHSRIAEPELDMQRCEPLANSLLERMLKLIVACQTGFQPLGTPSRAVDRRTQEFIPF